MSVITTNTGRRIFKKASSMAIVPYVYDGSVEDYVLGQDVYDISAIIGDSVQLEQEDGSVDRKENEFKKSPLLVNVESGIYKFSAQCLDLQNVVLQSLYGAEVANNGVTAMPDEYNLKYALIRVEFKDTSLPAIILPKVQMDNSLALGQLKSRASQGNIGGTALAAKVAAVDTSSVNTLAQFTNQLTGISEYSVDTPVIFVTAGQMPLFFHHYDENTDRYVFSSVNFSTGVVSHNVNADIESGTYS